MDKIYCPVCGSQDIASPETHEKSGQLTLGPSFVYEETIFTCNTCGTSGDFQDVNDKKFLDAQKFAQDIGIKQIINSLSEDHKISMAYFERAFELPVRTGTRWKSGDFSSSSIALLRIVKTFPWMTEIAEARFDPITSKKVMFREVVEEIISLARPGVYQMQTFVVKGDSLPQATFESKDIQPCNLVGA